MPILKFLPATEIETKFFRPKTKDVIEYLLKKMLFSQPELGIDDKPQSVQITKEFLESWIAQGLNLRKIASGNYPIDVYSETGYYGIDVKFMSVSNPLSKSKELMTNESSLLQNFKEGGIDLDMNFSQKQSDVILNKWKILLTQKMKRVTDIHSLKNIY